VLFKAPWSTSGDRHFYAQWTTAAKIEADQWSLFSLTGWNVMIPGPPESLDAAHCRARADAATDERMRALWILMAQTWTKLEDRERLERVNVQGSV
jgi:hypothetical protein